MLNTYQLYLLHDRAAKALARAIPSHTPSVVELSPMVEAGGFDSADADNTYGCAVRIYSGVSGDLAEKTRALVEQFKIGGGRVKVRRTKDTTSPSLYVILENPNGHVTAFYIGSPSYSAADAIVAEHAA